MLQGKGIKPHRALEEDLKLTDQAMSYDGQRTGGEVKRSPPAAPGRRVGAPEGNQSVRPSTTVAAGPAGWPEHAEGTPDFGQRTSAQRLAYDECRLTRKFG